MMRSHEMGSRSRSRVWLLTVAFMAVAFGGLSVTASASVFDDVESSLADSLGVIDSVAGTILSAAIMASAAIALAVAKMNVMGIMMVLVVVMIMLVAIGWLPYWTVILVVMIGAAMFGSYIAQWYHGDAPSGGKK